MSRVERTQQQIQSLQQIVSDQRRIFAYAKDAFEQANTSKTGFLDFFEFSTVC